ncbi:28S ribosomal protein S5, mitochondrial [Thelotrema lepadinum]|nr:28S ribosomal protein S5, mitochondrial [Thelotrema lepadinum]
MSAARPLPRALASSRAHSLRIPTRSFLQSSRRRRKDDADQNKTVESASAAEPSLSTENGNWVSRSIARAKSSKPPVKGPNTSKHYTEEQYAELEKKYSAEQVEAIRAGEAAVNPEDIVNQGVINRGPMTLDYVDDFATIRPVIDKQPKAPETNYDPKLRFKTEDELTEDVGNWAKEVFSEANEGDLDPVQWQKFEDNLRLTVGKPEAELNPRDYEAPRLRKISDPYIRAQARASKAGRDDDEMAERYQRLEKITGMNTFQMKQLRIKAMVQRRVVNQTRMGKIASMYSLVIAGNKDGMLGIGEGKASTGDSARRLGIVNAMRSLTPIRRYENRTIFGDVKAKVGATELELFNRPPGFGLRCQDKIHEMCMCAGISDLAARVTRARNPMNTVKAAFQALTNQRDPEQIARGRGRKLVDLRKVYYAGNI